MKKGKALRIDLVLTYDCGDGSWFFILSLLFTFVQSCLQENEERNPVERKKKVGNYCLSFEDFSFRFLFEKSFILETSCLKTG